jgi:hypothetical protein
MTTWVHLPGVCLKGGARPLVGVLVAMTAMIGAAASSSTIASASAHLYPSTTALHLTPTGGPVGTVFSASAKLGGHNPTCGVSNKKHEKKKNNSPCVTFEVFASSNCSTGGITSTEVVVKVNLKHIAVDPTTFTGSTAGTYSWLSKYRGDSDNGPSQDCVAFTVTAAGGTSGSGTRGTGGVLGASTSVPNTGYAIPVGQIWAGLLLLLAGPQLVVFALRSRRNASSERVRIGSRSRGGAGAGLTREKGRRRSPAAVASVETAIASASRSATGRAPTVSPRAMDGFAEPIALKEPSDGVITPVLRELDTLRRCSTRRPPRMFPADAVHRLGLTFTLCRRGSSPLLPANFGAPP